MMAFARAILLAFAILATSLAKSGYAAPENDDVSSTEVAAPDSDKALGAGDTVSLQIMEDNTPAVLKRISDTGDLDVPYIGRVHAAGKSCSEVAAQISRQLEKYYYKVTVKLAIEQINTKKLGTAGKVFLSGAVKLTSPQEIPPGETLTVSGAIVKAGGATNFGDLRKVKLTRKNKDGTGSKTYIIDVKGVLEEGKMDKDMELMDGDFIFVPQRLFTM